MCVQRLLPACRNALAPEREHDRFEQGTPVSHWKGNMPERERHQLDGKVAQALTLALAACEQAVHELDNSDARVDGLAEELRSLNARLYVVLGGSSAPAV